MPRENTTPSPPRRAVMRTIFRLVGFAACLSLAFLGCDSESTSPNGNGHDQPDIPVWEYGESHVYEVPATPGARVVDDLTGSVFRVPAGGGRLTVRQLTGGPQTLPDENGFEVEYDAGGVVELLIDHDPDDYDYLLGYVDFADVVLESTDVDSAGWLPIPASESVNDTLIFELPLANSRLYTERLAVLRGPKAAQAWRGTQRFKRLHYEAGTEHAVLTQQVDNNIREAANNLIEIVPEARRVQVMADVDGDLKPTLYVPKNRSAYYRKVTPKYVPFWDLFGLIPGCAIVIPDDALGSVAHEVGHYLHHILVGNSKFYEFARNARPSGHHVGMSGALNQFIEEPAYFAEYYLKGTVGTLGPEQGTFLSSGANGATPRTVDYRDLEGMGVAMFASVIRESNSIRNYANELVRVPVIQGERNALWQGCYEIIAQGSDDILEARDRLETWLAGSGQAGALPAMLQPLGWTHHVKCRFVDELGDGVPNLTARSVCKVGQDEYRLSKRTSHTSLNGSYTLDQCYPGTNTLRIYRSNGDSLDVSVTVPWTTPTNVEYDLGEITVSDVHLLTLLRQNAYFSVDVTAYMVDGEDTRYAAFRVSNLWMGEEFSPLTWADRVGTFLSRHFESDIYSSTEYCDSVYIRVSPDARTLEYLYLYHAVLTTYPDQSTYDYIDEAELQNLPIWRYPGDQFGELEDFGYYAYPENGLPYVLRVREYIKAPYGEPFEWTVIDHLADALDVDIVRDTR